MISKHDGQIRNTTINNDNVMKHRSKFKSNRIKFIYIALNQNIIFSTWNKKNEKINKNNKSDLQGLPLVQLCTLLLRDYRIIQRFVLQHRDTGYLSLCIHHSLDIKRSLTNLLKYLYFSADLEMNETGELAKCEHAMERVGRETWTQGKIRERERALVSIGNDQVEYRVHP